MCLGRRQHRQHQTRAVSWHRTPCASRASDRQGKGWAWKPGRGTQKCCELTVDPRGVFVNGGARCRHDVFGGAAKVANEATRRDPDPGRQVVLVLLQACSLAREALIRRHALDRSFGERLDGVPVTRHSSAVANAGMRVASGGGGDHPGCGGGARGDGGRAGVEVGDEGAVADDNLACNAQRRGNGRGREQHLGVPCVRGLWVMLRRDG